MSMFAGEKPMAKVLLKNTTRMSLHERFTFLRNTTNANPNRISPRQNQRELQQRVARNRRLAMQMEQRPAVIAALKIKKRSLRQRLGQAGAGAINAAERTSIKDRLNIGQRGGRKLGVRGGAAVRQRSRSRQRMGQQLQQLQQRRGRPRGGRQKIGRGGGGGRLSRSQSMQSLNSVKMGSRGRSRSRSRSRVRTNSISYANNLNPFRARSRSRSRSRGGIARRGQMGPGPQRGRFNMRGGIDRGGRGNRRGGRIFRNSQVGGGGRAGRRGNMRGGARRGGRGRGGRGGINGNKLSPTKEDLDNELEQYMANSRYVLDKDLDSYMKEASGHISSDIQMEEAFE